MGLGLNTWKNQIHAQMLLAVGRTFERVSQYGLPVSWGGTFLHFFSQLSAEVSLSNSPPNAPGQLAVVLHGRHRRRWANVSINE